MSLKIIGNIRLTDNYSGLEKYIVEEFSFIVDILLNDDITFKGASKFLTDNDFSYFDFEIRDNSIFVKQKNVRLYRHENILEKIYEK